MVSNADTLPQKSVLCSGIVTKSRSEGQDFYWKYLELVIKGLII
jgi:hypothetical protein